jgi:hypothetical protein
MLQSAQQLAGKRIFVSRLKGLGGINSIVLTIFREVRETLCGSADKTLVRGLQSTKKMADNIHGTNSGPCFRFKISQGKKRRK